MIQELIIRFDYHSAKTVKKLREIEVEIKNIEDEKTLQSLKNTAKELQKEYESRLKPVVLEIAFNIEAKMQKMSDEEILEKFDVRDANSSIIGECVYNICQKLERQPSRKTILDMMPERFRTN